MLSTSDRKGLIRLQLAGWLAIAMLYYALDQARQDDPDYLEQFFRAIVWAGWGGVISTTAWAVYGHFFFQLGSARASIAVALIGGSLSGALWYATFQLTDWLFVLEDGFLSPFEVPWSAIFDELTAYIFAMVTWHGVAIAQAQLLHGARERTRRAQAEQHAQAARLQMLQYQLHPHFLFNALNSVSATIDEDPLRAQTMVDELAQLLRHTLRDADEGSTVSDELEAIRSYLHIEAIRFEDKLDLKIEVPRELLSLPLPPQLIHPLIENAIKHGMRSSPMPLRVRFALEELRDPWRLSILVENSGRILPQPQRRSKAIGNENLRQRLIALYPERHRFELAEVGSGADTRVVAQIEIELEEIR